MTALETIKFVAEKLEAQKYRCVASPKESEEFDIPIGSCLYRGPEGKCGAGWLIPDELYSRTMENKGVLYIITNFPEVAAAMLPSDLSEQEGRMLLCRIQNIHDNFAEVRWKAHFADLEIEYAALTASTQL